MTELPQPPGEYGQVPKPGLAPDGREYASWLNRVGAWLIDFIPVFILTGIGTLIFNLTGSTEQLVVEIESGVSTSVEVVNGSPAGIIIRLIFFLGAIAYWIWNKGIREGSTGKSYGKQILGYTTVSEKTGEPLGAAQGVLRVLLLAIDFAICYVGVLWPLWDHKRQALLSDKGTSAVVFKD